MVMVMAMLMDIIKKFNLTKKKFKYQNYKGEKKL
jgi:hypothetical protein